MGCRLLENLSLEYYAAVSTSYSVFPPPELSDTVVDTYNAVLSLPYLLGNTTLATCVENEALFNICSGRMGIRAPTHADMNALVAQAMAGVTASMR